MYNKFRIFSNIVVFFLLLATVIILATCGGGGKNSTGTSGSKDGSVYLQNSVSDYSNVTIKVVLSVPDQPDKPPVEVTVEPSQKVEISGGVLKGGTKVLINLEAAGPGTSGARTGKVELTVDGTATVRVNKIGQRGETNSIQYDILSE